MEEKISTGSNELPEAPTDDHVERIAKKFGATTAERDALPLEGE